jgi:hypothetical protein
MMLEWILVAIICAAAIVMVAHTIDELMQSAAALRVRSHRFPGSPVREKQLASGVDPGSDDEARKLAA